MTSQFPMIALGEVALISAGGGAPQNPDDFSTEGIPFIRAGSLKPLVNGASESSQEHLSEKSAVKHGLKLFPANSVLFAKSGMSATKGHIYRLRNPAYVVNHLAAVVSGPELDARYLEYVLGVFSPTTLIQDAAYPSIRLSDISAMNIPLPLLSEQRRIAAILDQADALRSKRREALAQLDSLTQSIFMEMFGDPAKNPKNWTTQTLGEVTLKITDGEHLNPVFSQEGMPMVMAGNVLEDGVDLNSAKRVEASLGVRFRKKCNPEIGDLLVVSRGATIGRMCSVQVSGEFCLMGSVILIKVLPKILNSTFLSGLLKHPVMKSALFKASGSSAQQAIYLKDLKTMSCMVPPLELQQQFSEKVTAIDKVKAVHLVSINELDTLFASLQHSAFQGEL